MTWSQRLRQKEFLGASAGLLLLLIAFVYRWTWQDEERRAPLSMGQKPLPQLELPRLGPVPTTNEPRSGPVPLPELDLAPGAVPLAPGKVEAGQLDAAKALLVEAEAAERAGKLFGTGADSAAAKLLLAYQQAGANLQVAQAVQGFLNRQLANAHERLDRDDADVAKSVLGFLEECGIEDRRGVDLSLRLDRLPTVAEELAAASERIKAGQIYDPVGRSALDHFQRATQLDGRNLAARNGLEDAVRVLLKDALSAATMDEFETALARVDRVKKVWADAPGLLDTGKKIDGLKSRFVEGLVARAKVAMEANQAEGVEALLNRAKGLGASESALESVRAQQRTAKLYDNLKPGQRFVDRFSDRSGQTPEMVVLPIGQFPMGSKDARRHPNESPRHEVVFTRGFALSRGEITVREFREFVSSSGYRTEAEEQGGSQFYDERAGRLTQRQGVHWRQSYNGEDAQDAHPVVHVSWNDARMFAEWLANRTGLAYRLPSEAEFEYALSQGKALKFPWGDAMPTKVIGNLTGDGDRSPSARTWTKSFRRYKDGFWGTAPVGSFRTNAFGLIDVDGNVSEWVEDCWHENYQRAPADGGAWVNLGCDKRVVRGPSWGSAPEDARTTQRDAVSANTRSARVGFRVARDL